ncbi:low-density lipoprotein receptor class A domain-containing protein 2 [Canis lupus familiaris]|uniref:low-density lipoprotein receptor class A domain-containing protein 2 n=1 Tax=Canis lupus familiaris TaxID=9615 RepID=UPI0002257147|nr:low-density lipoprotein receptor class A domain-containing protein 2 [Canis lupus familiaris]XP_038513838.1 low-density lipoprotein receptor class A domain-containing protein 2 [Canis lupus familiaris]|eukprot:XP_003638974.1 low-density lipoprotein receptor class A domain-containing protein 2 [Canis lupus familiaris]
MEACPLQLLLLGAAALAASALETADLAARCGRTWQGAGLLLRSHAASRSSYFVARDADCALWMRAAAAGDRIRFQFRFFLVYSLAAAAPGSPAPPANPAAPAASAAPADPCAPGSYVQFYEGPPGAPRPLGARVCGRSIPAAVASSGPVLGLRLRTRGRQPRVAFVGEATSFRLGSCGAYFRCQNGRCIPPSLVCDRWGVDNCGDGSDQASWPPANCRGPSLAPSQAGSTDGPPPRPLTLSPALGSAGPLQVAAGRSSLAGRAPEQQDAAAPPGGPRLRAAALVSSLVLASAGLLLGLLWCCCASSRLARQAGARGLCPHCSICPCLGQVAPGGLQPSGPAFQGQGGRP